MSWNFPKAVPALAAALLLLAAPAGSALAADQADQSGPTAQQAAEVFLLQGIAGRTLDISLDGKQVQPNAKPKAVIGPLRIDPGSHQVVLRDSSGVVAKGRFRAGAGQSMDVIAHLLSDAGQKPTVDAYRNNLRPVAPGKLRLAVAHTAAVPPADIRVNDKVLFANVANGETLDLVVPAATYRVDIVPTGTDGPSVLGPVELPLRAGTLTRVFAIGNVAKGTMDAIVHTLPVRQLGAVAPSSVPTGNGGQAATSFIGGTSWPARSLLAGSVLAALLGLGLLVRRPGRIRQLSR